MQTRFLFCSHPARRSAEEHTWRGLQCHSLSLLFITRPEMCAAAIPTQLTFLPVPSLGPLLL